MLKAANGRTISDDRVAHLEHDRVGPKSILGFSCNLLAERGGKRAPANSDKSPYAVHLMGRLALKLSSSSVVPFKFLIAPLACALNRKGGPRDKPLGCCGEACRASRR